ncbi:MAG TPA: hypothetical protein VHS53_19065, partial [Mucilaginibacter sp.]|nr:hypothetical protein [Mucilaginibacter sp.]
VFDNADHDNLEVIQDMIKNQHLDLKVWHVGKKDGCLEATVVITGHKKHIRKLDQLLLKMPQVKAF